MEEGCKRGGRVVREQERAALDLIQVNVGRQIWVPQLLHARKAAEDSARRAPEALIEPGRVRVRLSMANVRLSRGADPAASVVLGAGARPTGNHAHCDACAGHRAWERLNR